MSDPIQIELLRDEWIALIAAAFYGSNALESEVGGHIAGTADRLIDQLKARLKVYSIRDAAVTLEEALPSMIAVPFTTNSDDTPKPPDTITLIVGDPPQTNEERRQEADWIARAGSLERFIKVRYVNGEGQETDRYGNILPSEED